ncbi:MAG TPA: hypothetical protein VM031_02865, partial [Phycisphaerae bacterium]|nr:hypothetical protein [Phycisphaerae bacterium]
KEFADPGAVSDALGRGEVGIHEAVLLGSGSGARRTTVGRALFNGLLPEGMDWVDEPVTAGLLRRLLMACWRLAGPAVSARLADALMRFGFHHATLSGLSLGMDLLKPYSRLEEVLGEAWGKAGEIEARHGGAAGADEELDAALLEHWWEVSEQLTGAALEELARDRGGLNSLHVMLASGARGGRVQTRQLVAMRGLMALPTGRVLPTPITTNFLRGHSPLEYLASMFGARRGLADTALKTAEAGFLYKRIMGAVQDVVISQADCGTPDGLVKRALRDGDSQTVPLAERIVGRTALEDIRLDGAKAPLVRRGEAISPEAAERIAAAVPSVAVRSPVTCRAASGVCAACYGADVNTWQPARPGLPVGVLAAQSIGEPMTQLTMRTFHLGVPGRRKAGGGQQPRETIIGGIPRLEQLLEAGRPFGRVESGERRALVELLGDRGAAAVAEAILAGIHRVYRRQGVRIDDRHLEVVLREMLGRLRVTDPGETDLVGGELVTAGQLEAANRAAGRDASAEPTVVGVTEAAASTGDFLVAASSYGGLPAFARAAARKQKLALRGIRSCTAFGKLTPAPPRGGP